MAKLSRWLRMQLLGSSGPKGLRDMIKFHSNGGGKNWNKKMKSEKQTGLGAGHGDRGRVKETNSSMVKTMFRLRIAGGGERLATWQRLFQ